MATLRSSTTVIALLVSGVAGCQAAGPAAGLAPPGTTPHAVGESWVASVTAGSGVPWGTAAAEYADVWVADTVLAEPIDGVDAATLAHDLGTEVEDGGTSGYVVVHVPKDRAVEEYLQLLKDHPWIESGSRASFIQGSSDHDTMSMRAHPGQWHLVSARAPLPDERDLSGIVVAVLDTGVAYEHHEDERFAYVPAPSLQNVAFVSPWDFVNDDSHANDDHQHGTHIASLIASSGDVEGTAPGVTLMPIKVLDEHNRGTELDLVAGIHHAVEHGAHVINMSLSFPPGYVPSRALEEALVRAHEAGVVMVAAAGNQGMGTITWPAASRLVIGVGSTHPAGLYGPDDDWDTEYVHEAPYSNRSNALDLLAPGGLLDMDRTGDGWVDGMLAETILPGDPSQTAYWLYAGTSQAAALVSGAAATLLSAGASPTRVARLLHQPARDEGLAAERFTDGIGGGSLDVWRSLRALERRNRHVYADQEPSAGILVYLRQTATGVVPVARVWPVDAIGEPLRSDVIGTLTWDSQARAVSCEVEHRYCELVGPEFEEGGADTYTPDAFLFTVDGVVIRNVAFRPTAAVFLTDSAEVLLAAVEADASLAGSLIGFHLPAGDDPILGPVAESYMIHNHGTGPASAPAAALLRPGATGVVAPVQVDLDGSGLLSSPLGLVPARRLDGGGGSIVSFDGTEMLSSALGLHPAGFHGYQGPAGSGLLSSPLGLSGGPVDLGRLSFSAELDGSHLGAALDSGGFRFDSEEEALNAMVGSGQLRVPYGPRGSGAMSLAID